MYSMPSREQIVQHCEQALRRLREVHLRAIADSRGPVVYISDAYPGVWLEHVYDGLVWASLTGEWDVAKAYIRLFLDHQREDGRLPCYVWQEKTGYGQLQECVSFASLAWEVYETTRDEEFLREAYEKCCLWDKWLCEHRNGSSGLIEMHCGYDTGHDNSARLDGMRHHGSEGDGPALCPVAPVIAPDINAVFFGDRTALSKMAAQLGLAEDNLHWILQATRTRQLLLDTCLDPQELFFYDVDKNGVMRKCRSISVTNVFSEKVLGRCLVHSIFDRYFRHGAEFDTPYPWPSVSSADPLFERRLPGNSWGYYSQGLTMLRTLRWMKHYGLEDELHENMRRWLSAWTDSARPFGQELDPFTGEPSESSPWYSSTMLFYLVSAKELGFWPGVSSERS
ncbi:MAG: hypothetical protein Q4A66_02480 [Eubacteriales bacterium]|nr:hypothetical protein [Eubacteriales bacterium]